METCGRGSTLGSGDETVEGTYGLQRQPCFTAEDITDGGSAVRNGQRR